MSHIYVCELVVNLNSLSLPSMVSLPPRWHFLIDVSSIELGALKMPFQTCFLHHSYSLFDNPLTYVSGSCSPISSSQCLQFYLLTFQTGMANPSLLLVPPASQIQLNTLPCYATKSISVTIGRGFFFFGLNANRQLVKKSGN